MALVAQQNHELLEGFKQHVADALEYRGQAKAQKSLETYQWAWKKFVSWCEDNGYDPFVPPNNSHVFLVSIFIASMAKTRQLKTASLTCYIAGIKHHYGEKGIILDTAHAEMRKIWTGIRRELGTKQKQKIPLTTENIKTLVDSLSKPNSSITIRDKAMILLGFAGAFRRSELVGIDLEHLAFDQNGVSIFLPKSKTDQEMQGRFVDIPFASEAKYCPVRALKEWIQYAQIESGPIFLQIQKAGAIIRKRLGGRSVALMLQRRCKQFGFSKDIGGHSLRSGHVTSAIKNGTPETWIMRQTGHTNVATMRKYERMKKEFKANSAAKIGL